MRLHEIEQAFRIRATKRFLKNLSAYLKGYTALSTTFRKFCEAKAKGQRFGRKDGPFSAGSPLKGVNHSHLIHGKVVVIYRSNPAWLDLYDIVEHNGFEGPRIGALAAYVRSVVPADFTNLNTETKTLKLVPDQLRELDHLFYDVATSDRPIINAALNGDLTDLMYFARETVDADDETIFASYGGEIGFQSHLATIVKKITA